MTGKYDFTLVWTPDPRPGAAEVPLADDAPGITIFAALRSQMGLTLEPRKAPVEVLVVDRAMNEPAEN